ncbi:hypothetical protein HJA86_28515 [Rhizobium bangladeshense]|nr:hypothetical protein [Rhizobium bangladeshense]
MKAVLNAVLDGKIKSFRNEFLDHARDVFLKMARRFTVENLVYIGKSLSGDS